MKALGLLLAAILVPGAMAMAITENRPSSYQRRPCYYYSGCYSSISSMVPEREESLGSHFEWNPVPEERPWNRTLSFHQRLQRFREFLMSVIPKEDTQTSFQGLII